MSTTNGTSNGLPAGAELATKELLRAANIKAVRVPGLSAALGREIYVQVRRLRKADYYAFLPPMPPEVLEATEAADREARYAAWFARLSPDEQGARRRANLAVVYQVLAAAMVEPRVSAEEAVEYADDADVIATAVLELSGILEPARALESAEALAVAPSAG